MERSTGIQRATPEIWTHSCFISGLNSSAFYLMNFFVCAISDLKKIHHEHRFLRIT